MIVRRVAGAAPRNAAVTAPLILPHPTVAEPPGGGVPVAFPPPGVETVVFDVVGTLVTPDPPVAAIYRATALRRGIDVGEEDVRAAFARAWRRQETLDATAVPPHVTSRARERDRWRSIVDDVFPGAAQAPQIFAELWDHFGSPSAWRPLEQGVALVAAARAAGVEVALASNFDERLLAIAPAIAPLALARHVFASSELGWRKPALGFFRAVEARLGRRPDQLLLVGDDPRLDLAAARSAGWQARAVDA